MRFIFVLYPIRQVTENIANELPAYFSHIMFFLSQCNTFVVRYSKKGHTAVLLQTSTNTALICHFNS